ncbi:transcriptional regulator, TetR family [Paenibacillus sp. 1_12]|uniref:TetR/AcrR family transcriptional regulator n=1 Tax=Paenibacillus sp. 1_12 TaxID=1566278 RepID=UPI0008E3E78C|nr:TetR/AcrR family transcriptional regulator [Paenibacillus sp. 1_12]SFL10113.1 transcriptional regulator, TetR family [Paenibacillus sp. 1_12]
MILDSRYPDRRILRTRTTIVDAFVSLIFEKGFSAISVKDITTGADVNRSTFYAHYQDKYDLLDKLIKEKLEDLSHLIRPDHPSALTYTGSFDEPDPFFMVLFTHLTDNKRFYQAMLTKLEPEHFTLKLYEVIRESFYAKISNMKMEQKLSVPLDILLNYSSSSVMGVILNWINDPTMYTPQYMALQLTRLTMLGTYRTMGLFD